MTQRMKFPAPIRCSHEVADGKYVQRPWAVQDVKDYLAIGGWFYQGKHEFADVQAAKIANAGSIL